MALYKDKNGQVHDDMEGAAIHLLPVDCVPITDEEAAILRAPTPQQLKALHNAEILFQIAQIEAAQVRPTRELLLDPASAFAKDKLLMLDAQILELRTKIIP